MNFTHSNSVGELRQGAIEIIGRMSGEQVALALRVLDLDNEAIDDLLASGCKGYANVLAFVNAK